MIRAVRPLGLAGLDLASETRASLAVCRSIAVPLAAAPRRLDWDDIVVVDHPVSSRIPSVDLPSREQGCCSLPIGVNKVEGRRRHGLARKIRRWTDSYLGPRRRICRAVLGGERFENHLLKHHLVALPDRQLVRMQLGPLCLATIDGILDVGAELVQKVVARTGDLPRPRLFELLLALELRGVNWALIVDLFRSPRHAELEAYLSDQVSLRVEDVWIVRVDIRGHKQKGQFDLVHFLHLKVVPMWSAGCFFCMSS